MKSSNRWLWVVLVISTSGLGCAVPKQGVRTLVDLVIEVCEDKQDPKQADIADCFKRVEAEQQAQETQTLVPLVP